MSHNNESFSIQVKQVIEVSGISRGVGSREDPTRWVTHYYDMSGERLAIEDPLAPLYYTVSNIDSTCHEVIDSGFSVGPDIKIKREKK